MTASDLERFSDEELQRRLVREIREATLSPLVVPCAAPQAILLGGQSGAGKTTLHKIFQEQFVGNVIVINGDEYRRLHPRFSELRAAFGDGYVERTAAWAGRMTEALVDRLSRFGYNLIIEGTLRTAEVPLNTARLLIDRGYEVSLALMAVKPEISLISCQIRYEEMRIAGTTPRATDPAHHNKIVQQIVENLGTLEQSSLFQDVYLYNRSRQRLYPPDLESGHNLGFVADNVENQKLVSKGVEGQQDAESQQALCGQLASASEALRIALFGPWTSEEQDHYAKLQAKLERLKTR